MSLTTQSYAVRLAAFEAALRDLARNVQAQRDALSRAR